MLDDTEVILMVIQNDIHWVIIESDSRAVVNVINGKVSVPKGIVKIVENIRRL